MYIIYINYMHIQYRFAYKLCAQISYTHTYVHCIENSNVVYVAIYVPQNFGGAT